MTQTPHYLDAKIQNPRAASLMTNKSECSVQLKLMQKKPGLGGVVERRMGFWGVEENDDKPPYKYIRSKSNSNTFVAFSANICTSIFGKYPPEFLSRVQQSLSTKPAMGLFYLKIY